MLHDEIIVMISFYYFIELDDVRMPYKLMDASLAAKILADVAILARSLLIDDLHRHLMYGRLRIRKIKNKKD